MLLFFAFLIPAGCFQAFEQNGLVIFIDACFT